MSSDFRFFDFDPFTGIRTDVRFERDAKGNRLATQFLTTQDVEPILEANKRERYNAKGKATEKGRMGFKVASIPISVQYKWLTEEGWDCLSPDPDCQKKLRQKLNDPEWRHLRCAELVV